MRSSSSSSSRRRTAAAHDGATEKHLQSGSPPGRRAPRARRPGREHAALLPLAYEGHDEGKKETKTLSSERAEKRERRGAGEASEAREKEGGKAHARAHESRRTHATPTPTPSLSVGRFQAQAPSLRPSHLKLGSMAESSERCATRASGSDDSESMADAAAHAFWRAQEQLRECQARCGELRRECAGLRRECAALRRERTARDREREELVEDEAREHLLQGAVRARDCALGLLRDCEDRAGKLRTSCV